LVLVVRQQLGRAADVLAIALVLDQTLDLDGDGLVHLVRDDFARQGARRLLGFSGHFLAPTACAVSRVFTRAMCLRTRPNSEGFTIWPLADCMRRLNCSRRSRSSSVLRPSLSLPRSDFMASSFLLISAPDASRTWWT